VVFRAAMEVLRPRLDVIAVPVRALDGPLPIGPGTPVDGEALDAVVEGRRVPGLAVARAHDALVAMARRGRDGRALLDPADDDEWRVATLVGPWSEGMAGFDPSGDRLIEAVRSEQLLVLWLTPSELSEIRWRAKSEGNWRDVLTAPGDDPSDRSSTTHPVVVALFLVAVAPGLWSERVTDLQDAYSTPLSTAVDLLLLTTVTGLVVGGLRILLVAARRRWLVRRPRR